MINARLGYFFHPVHDLKLAYGFFKDVLGFNLKYSNLTDVTQEKIETYDLSNMQWLEFDAGNVTLLVQHVPGIKPYETGIGFDVPNCDEAFVYFKNNGVEIASSIQGIGDRLRFFEIKDPTGSVFNIFGK